ncbi:stalk domain-containing protein [Paenibacillus sp. YAF4_2]|uniref:stalk domain-containing protein n=1 Tax=Paenibacillus sp. YAF4_2 TaxID=3233085 RepID=UPI003F9A76EF
MLRSNKALIALLVCTAVFSTTFLTGAAFVKQSKLPTTQDKVLPLTIYKYGDKTKEQVRFRTDGDYEWRWGIVSADQFSYSTFNYNWIPSSGNNIGYSDDNNVYYEVTPQGERNWTFFNGREFDRIDSERMISIEVKSQESQLIIEGEESAPSTEYGSLTMLNRSGQTLLESEYILPKQFFSNPYSFDSDGNLIILRSDGIASFSKKGTLNWIYNDGVSAKIGPDSHSLFGSTSVADTNVNSITAPKTNEILVGTDEGLLILSNQGKLVSNNSLKPAVIQMDNGTNLVDLYVSEDGLYWINGEFYKKEEIIENYNNGKFTVGASALPEAKWSKGVYKAGKSNDLSAYDTQGNVKWKYYTSSWSKISNLAADSEGNVFFTDQVGNIYGLDSNGNEKFIVVFPNKDEQFYQLRMTVKVNGKTKKLTVAPQSIKSTGYIPASIVASALGLQEEWDPKLNEIRFGTPVELAEDAIKRFLIHVERGEEQLANAELRIAGSTFEQKAPRLAVSQSWEKWLFDIQEMKVKTQNNNSITIETKQHNQKFLNTERLVDETSMQLYSLKLLDDGQWHITNMDLR